MTKPNVAKLKTAALATISAVGLFAFAWFSSIPLVFVFLFFIFGAYLLVLSVTNEDKKYNFFALGFLLVLGIAAASFMQEYSSLSAYLVPVAAVSMLVSLLYHDLELALIFSVILSIFTGIIYQGDMFLAIVLLIGGVLGSLIVWKARRRFKIISAGFYVGLVQAVCVLTFFEHSITKIPFVLRLSLFPFLNGIICSSLVAWLLPLFEYLFKVVTNISLLELADFNHPLLKRMVLEAPGTYHHSLMVGNLAEVACEAVGANSLLARVGSYYHDIGKLDKPEYFSENQDRFSSKHDELSASMSKLVIMDHVKGGLELAKKSHLNNAIIEFIQQHHGTSLVFYFYRRAMENAQATEGVQEEVFRYPGPKPQTKETAIVLLADSVEAACRTLEEPTAERISDMVRKIINNKFIDGQLDACDLTLRDLEKIATTFTHILVGFYHSRVEYPSTDAR
ncbi:MAG: HDIG domain-containing metalloprotein [Candidatus Omnitrophota bacterium]